MKKPSPHKPVRSTVQFRIDNMDTLGQGVFKDQDGIGFIAKTLPGESGTARLLKARKGVRFAKYTALETVSPERIAAACPHFDTCPGCHYLHTGYARELAYKQQALEHLLHRLPVNNAVEVIPAPRRLAYRNRIQLHYRGEKIGLIDGLTDAIVEIPDCMILDEKLQPGLHQLYSDKSWAREHGKQGHCELYLKDEGISLQWNREYAHGGFTQVFDDMNRRLCEEITHDLQQEKPASLLDLFAGDGNLSNAYVHDNSVHRVMVDATPSVHCDFIELDLFADDALKKFQKRCKDKSFDTVVLDPPRKGFPALDAWVKHYRPRTLIYVSCNPATLARDLQSLGSTFRIDRTLLLDLFPGTYHFETMVSITFKKQRQT